MTQDINWDYFPEPYDKELPLYFGKALERFSSDEGLELLNFLLEVARRQTTGDRSRSRTRWTRRRPWR